MKHNQMFKKIVAFCLMFSLIFSLYGGFPVIARADSASAAEAADSQLSADSTAKILQPTDSKILNYVDEEVFMSGNHVARLPEEETLSSYVFQNADGSRTVYYLDEAVKFVDSNGVIREKDVSLTATRGGYVTTANDVVLTLPDDPASGIRLTYDGHMVSLVPQGGKLTGMIREGNVVTYPDYYGKGVSLVYTPTLSGVKEDIVLSEYTGVNSFTFMLNTGGLNLYQSNGKFYLAEGKGAVERIDLGQVVTFDAHGRFSIGTMTSETVMAGNLYRLTITVDEAFLLDENTTYPVSIDPTITVSDNITGANAIEDVTIYSGTPNLTANWGYLHAGYYDSTYKVARTLFRLSGLINDDIYQTVNWANISSVEFYIREATGSPGVSVNLHAGSSSWTETGATWNNTHATSWDGEVYATASPSYEAYATYDITWLVQDWKRNSPSGTLGFYLQSTNETSEDKAFYSSEFTTTANRPYVVFNYYNVGTNLTVDEGSTVAIDTSDVPSGVTWESSDTTVATVNSSGVVTGRRAGSVTITAKLNGKVEKTVHGHVTVPTGVYYVKNLNSNYYLCADSGNVLENTPVIQTNKLSNTAQEYLRITQMWKIKHIGSGRYSIRPYHKLDMGLYAGDDSAEIRTIGQSDTTSAIPSLGEWKITWNSNGYVLQADGLSGDTLQPINTYSDNGDYIVASTYSNTSNCKWELTEVEDPPVGVVLYDMQTGYRLTSLRRVAVDETKTMNDLNIVPAFYSPTTTSHIVSLATADQTVATVDNTSKSVSGVSTGQTTITARKYYGGEYKTASFTLIVLPIASGTYYLRNKGADMYAEPSELSNGSPVLQKKQNGNTAQKWVFEYDNSGYYNIYSAASTNKFYLKVNGNSSSEYESIVLGTNKGDSGAKWKIEATGNGGYKITPKCAESSNYVLSASDEGINEGDPLYVMEYQNDTDFSDEWNIVPYFTLTLNVHFDSYYKARSGNTVESATEDMSTELETMKQFYYDEFNLVITNSAPSLMTTSLNSCSNLTSNTMCSCSTNCANHHTNHLNFMASITPPSNATSATVLFAGHNACIDGGAEHGIFGGHGLANKETDCVAIFVYDTDAKNTKTLVHELGHLFGAEDHYDDPNNPTGVVATTEQMNDTYGDGFSDCCIYGFYKEEPNVISELNICDGCRRMIMKNLDKYTFDEGE